MHKNRKEIYKVMKKVKKKQTGETSILLFINTYKPNEALKFIVLSDYFGFSDI